MEYVLFDLDGTLCNTQEGIFNCLIYSLNHYGIKVKDMDELKSFIGPPLHKEFERYCKFSPQQAMEAVEKYRERYKTIGLYENSLYDGMENALKNLKASGKKLCVATAKPEVFARKILEKHGVANLFDEIVGSNLDGTRTEKHEVIAEVFTRLNIANPQKAIMIGDRNYDVLGAKKFGMKCVGVTYGFGTRQELEAAGAAYIASTVNEMEKIILSI